MIKNYIKIAWRNLWKHKLFSFINIIGLGIAIPFALIAIIQLQSSFEFDNFHKNRDKIVRVITDLTHQNGSEEAYASSPYYLSEELIQASPFVEKGVRVNRFYGWVLDNGIKTTDVNAILVDPEFFSMFNFPLIKGTIPSEPHTLVLSEEMAIWFFGDADPVGKSLHHSNYGDFKITGVLQHYKPKTQFRSDIMVSMASMPFVKPDLMDKKNWNTLETHTFVQLQPSVTKEQFAQNLTLISEKMDGQEAVAANGDRLSFRAQEFDKISPSVEKLKFNPYIEDMQDIYFNFSIPLMILLLATFNYINLSLARSAARSREVGVRKVMGAMKKQLIAQFLIEAILVSGLALCIGMVLVYGIKSTVHVSWINWEVDNFAAVLMFFGVFTIILGVLAGAVPSMLMSGLQPVSVLKGEYKPGSFGKIGMRRVLNILQFVVSLAFVFQIGHLYNQFNYMANENDNFNRKNVFDLSLQEGRDPRLDAGLKALSSLENIGYTSQVFGNMPATIGIKKSSADEYLASHYYACDPQFLDIMDLKFIAGRNLPSAVGNETSPFVVVNEKAVEKLQMKDAASAIGQQMVLGEELVTIAGVVKNFCHFNYQFDIEPIAFQYNPAAFRVASLLTAGNADHNTFETEIKKVWAEFYPYEESAGTWLATDLYERYYPSEDLKLMGVTSAVIFIIAIMGLLGIIIYSSEKRVKEIGVRKVLGAPLAEIMRLVSKEYIKLLAIAVAFAIPIGIFAGVVMTNLFTFNNGINYGLMLCFVAFIGGVALAVIAYFAYKSSTSDPVIALKSE